MAARPTRAQASPGNLPPALSPERIRIAREIHGDEAVDRYLANLYLGDPLADALMLPTSELSAHQVDRLLHQAITHGRGCPGRSASGPDGAVRRAGPCAVVGGLAGDAPREREDPALGDAHRARVRRLRAASFLSGDGEQAAGLHRAAAAGDGPAVRQDGALRPGVVPARRPAERRGRIQNGRDRAGDARPRAPGDPPHRPMGRRRLRSAPEPVPYGHELRLLLPVCGRWPSATGRASEPA